MTPLAQITVDVSEWLEAFQVLGPFLGIALFLSLVQVIIIAKFKDMRLRLYAQAAVITLIIAACTTALIVGMLNAF